MPADRATWRAFLLQACLNSAVPFTLIAWAETRLGAGLAVYGAVFAFVFVMALFLYLTDKSLEWVLYDLVLGWKKS